jgi:hypothetical protein
MSEYRLPLRPEWPLAGYFEFTISFRLEQLHREVELHLLKGGQLQEVWSLHSPGRFTKKFSAKLWPNEKKELQVIMRLKSADFPELEVSIDESTVTPTENTLDFKRALLDAYLPLIQSSSIGANEELDPQAVRVVEMVKAAISARRPFSLIRLGDGEGRLLGYPNYFSLPEIVDECIGYQFGIESVRYFLKTDPVYGLHNACMQLNCYLKSAIQSADMVFLPGGRHFENSSDGTAINALVGQLLCVLEVMKLRGDQIAPSADHFIFRDIQRMGLWSSMLAGVDAVSVISHTNPAEVLASRFGISDVYHIPIPGHKTFMSSDEVHFPVAMKRVVETIPSNASGVYLIAAGYLGKYYCDVVKSRGGIALDIGSIFDYWVQVGRADALKDPALSN